MGERDDVIPSPGLCTSQDRHSALTAVHQTGTIGSLVLSGHGLG